MLYLITIIFGKLKPFLAQYGVYVAIIGALIALYGYAHHQGEQVVKDADKVALQAAEEKAKEITHQYEEKSHDDETRLQKYLDAIGYDSLPNSTKSLSATSTNPAKLGGNNPTKSHVLAAPSCEAVRGALDIAGDILDNDRAEVNGD